MTSVEAIGLGFCHSTGAIGKTIQWVTTPLHKVLSSKARSETATHVFVWFRDNHGNVEYFEALEGAGWQGPFPISKVHEWVAEEKGRWVKEYDLTRFLALTKEQMIARYSFCSNMLEYWDYNTPQLALQLRTMGLGRRIIPASPRDVICSEAGSRICHSDILDFREWCNKRNHDDISPFKLHQAVLKLLEKKH
jgi:hypothetical protein